MSSIWLGSFLYDCRCDRPGRAMLMQCVNDPITLHSRVTYHCHHLMSQAPSSLYPHPFPLYSSGKMLAPSFSTVKPQSRLFLNGFTGLSLLPPVARRPLLFVHSSNACRGRRRV